MKNTPKFIIVHHTGGTQKDPKADTSHHDVDIIRDWHVNGLGWKDVGYHYVITKDGTLQKGREENVAGAHCKGYNTKSIGICLAGNFDVTKPTKKQEATLKTLLGEMMVKYDITLDNVVPHRKFANKTCYGSKLTDSWARDLVDIKSVQTAGEAKAKDPNVQKESGEIKTETKVHPLIASSQNKNEVAMTIKGPIVLVANQVLKTAGADIEVQELEVIFDSVVMFIDAIGIAMTAFGAIRKGYNEIKSKLPSGK